MDSVVNINHKTLQTLLATKSTDFHDLCLRQSQRLSHMTIQLPPMSGFLFVANYNYMPAYLAQS